MSQIQTFLAPFSRLLYSNRNGTIVVLCLLLAWVACYALINCWRNQRLVRELAQAKSDLSTSPAGRRYSSAPASPPEPVAEGGMLPPVKGGRTYARNLGSALQKAGMTPPAPQIYSPPTHQGWPPPPNAGQPAPGGAPPAPPYAPQPTPWGAPPQPTPSPWGYPAGANRSPMQGQPAPMPPLYQPQPAPPGPPGPPPGFYGPPASPAPPYGQPSFAATGMPPAQPSPDLAPAASGGSPTPTPVAPLHPIVAPFPTPQVPDAAAEAAQESGRRGKPKRRRFNLSVLDNLEKIVQSKAAEVTRTATPPAVAPAAPVVPAAPPASNPPAVAEAPAVEAQPAVAEASEPESLPLQFEAPTTEEAEAAPPAPALEVEAEPEPVPMTASQPEPEPATQAEPEPAPEPVAQTQPEAEAVPEAVAEPEPQWRTSMRTMMFGEEAARAAESATAEPQEATPAEPSRSGGEWTWGTMSAQREQPAETPADAVAPSSSPEPEPVAQEPVVSETDSTNQTEPVAEAEPPSEPVAEAVGPVAFPSESEPADQESAQPPAAQTEKPSAGTLVIIEDDHAAADYYSTLFKGNGYQVEVANDGVSGVDLCVRVQPQVILLDVMMPRQNGILVLQTLRASDETKNTPVVVMSNFSEPTLIKRALQLGALEYVIKTQVEGPALLEALPRWMNREKAFAAA